MSDLDRQLAEYIDAIADPVTLDEVAVPPVNRPVWRSRPVFAAVAGAAVVLIPILAIVFFARISGSDTTVPPAVPVSTTVTTVAPSSTTGAAPTTTAAPRLQPPSIEDNGFVVATPAGIYLRGPGGTAWDIDRTNQPTIRAVATDRSGGLYLARDGLVYFTAPGDPIRPDRQVALPVHPDASPDASRSLVWMTVGEAEILLHFGDDEDDFYGYDVAAGEPWREAVSAALADGLARVAGGRFALLTDEAGNDLEVADMGRTDVYLTVGNVAETDMTTVKVSTPFDDAVRIHDFDGRRVLLSRYPAESRATPDVPAPFIDFYESTDWDATYIMIDTECAGLFGCVEILVHQPGTAALTGALLSEGTLATELPAIGECSATGLSPGTLGLGDAVPPEAAQLTAELIMQLAGACDIAWLHEFARDNRRDTDAARSSILQLSHGRIDGIAGAEMSGLAPLANLIEVLQFEPGRRNDTTVWPAIAAEQLDWESLTDAEIDTLARVYDRNLLEESRALGGYAGLWVEIEDNGRWAFFGRNLS